LKEGDIQQVLDCRAAELTEKDLEQVTALCEAYCEEDLDAVVERHQLTTSVQIT
jgi:phage gp46-like protein